jgi:hypothetical protein
MAIQSNPNFDSKNQALTKHPLYLVLIEGLPEPLCTFRYEESLITWGGYGVGGYGTTGYGY